MSEAEEGAPHPHVKEQPELATTEHLSSSTYGGTHPSNTTTGSTGTGGVYHHPEMDAQVRILAEAVDPEDAPPAPSSSSYYAHAQRPVQYGGAPAPEQQRLVQTQYAAAPPPYITVNPAPPPPPPPPQQPMDAASASAANFYTVPLSDLNSSTPPSSGYYQPMSMQQQQQQQAQPPMPMNPYTYYQGQQGGLGPIIQPPINPQFQPMPQYGPLPLSQQQQYQQYQQSGYQKPVSTVTGAPDITLPYGTQTSYVLNGLVLLFCICAWVGCIVGFSSNLHEISISGSDTFYDSTFYAKWDSFTIKSSSGYSQTYKWGSDLGDQIAFHCQASGKGFVAMLSLSFASLTVLIPLMVCRYFWNSLTQIHLLRSLNTYQVSKVHLVELILTSISATFFIIGTCVWSQCVTNTVDTAKNAGSWDLRFDAYGYVIYCSAAMFVALVIEWYIQGRPHYLTAKAPTFSTSGSTSQPLGFTFPQPMTTVNAVAA